MNQAAVHRITARAPNSCCLLVAIIVSTAMLLIAHDLSAAAMIQIDIYAVIGIIGINLASMITENPPTDPQPDRYSPDPLS